MKQAIQKNPYDDLLVRTDEKPAGDRTQWKTVTRKIWEDDSDNRWRVRIIIANPAPFKFYVGYDVMTQQGGFFVNPGVEYNYAVNERNAILYALGRLLANCIDIFNDEQQRTIRQAIMDNRQLSLFD